MRKIKLALVGSLALVAGSAPAPAHDVSGDFTCTFKNATGEDLTWAFDVSIAGGTVAETAFLGHGKLVSSPAGARPIWTISADAGLITLEEPRGLSIEARDFRKVPGRGDIGDAVVFLHDRAIGVGHCGLLATGLLR